VVVDALPAHVDRGIAAIDVALEGGFAPLAGFRVDAQLAEADGGRRLAVAVVVEVRSDRWNL
jgi:hypothetical protein